MLLFLETGKPEIKSLCISKWRVFV